MACKGFLVCLLKLLNFLLTLAGLAMVGYGIYLFVEYKRASSDSVEVSPLGGSEGSIPLGRPMLVAISLSAGTLGSLPKAWFLYLFIGIGVILFIISFFGCIGMFARNSYFLCCYAVLIILLILAELGCAGFVYFDKSWEEEIPTDRTGDFTMIYDFFKEHWTIIKWVALGIVVLEVLIFILALIVRAMNKPREYDSDDEEFVGLRQQIREPLMSRMLPSASVPVAGAPDQRPSRTDAWSTRMREKYGLNTSQFTYNPSESDRLQQASQPTERRSRCTIM